MTTNTTRVFVYGSLLSGLGNHRVLGGTTCAGTTHTTATFTMLDLGSFPAVLSAARDDYAASVVGEVYDVTDDVLANLDRLEGYQGDGTGLYDRITVELADGTTALMYVMHDNPRSAWVRKAAIVDDSDWRTWLSNFEEVA